MIIPINIRQVIADEQSRLASLSDLRQRKLERLYQRKVAVESLIESLESYRQLRVVQRSERPELSAGQRCS